jgi:hypothetical protein
MPASTTCTSLAAHSLVNAQNGSSGSSRSPTATAGQPTQWRPSPTAREPSRGPSRLRSACCATFASCISKLTQPRSRGSPWYRRPRRSATPIGRGRDELPAGAGDLRQVATYPHQGCEPAGLRHQLKRHPPSRGISERAETARSDRDADRKRRYPDDGPEEDDDAETEQHREPDGKDAEHTGRAVAVGEVATFWRVPPHARIAAMATAVTAAVVSTP